MAKRNIQLFVLLMVGSIPAFGHPGHGHFAGNSLAHYLTSTEHLLPIALGVVAGIFIYEYWWKPLRKRVDK